MTCIKGHSANWHPDPIVTCYNGSWLGGECLPDPCFTDPPFDNVDEAASLCENTTSGNTCSYVCETNYEPNGNATCLNGEWLNDTRCVHLPCVENPVGIEFMNSSSTDCAFTESGEECEIACNDGYTFMGAPPTCHIAVWNISSSHCEESPCGNFSIEHLDDSSNHSLCNSTWCLSAKRENFDHIPLKYIEYHCITTHWIISFASLPCILEYCEILNSRFALENRYSRIYV